MDFVQTLGSAWWVWIGIAGSLVAYVAVAHLTLDCIQRRALEAVRREVSTGKFFRPDGKPVVITVTSLRGGCGKTTLAQLLGEMLDAEVVSFDSLKYDRDADPQNPWVRRPSALVYDLATNVLNTTEAPFMIAECVCKEDPKCPSVRHWMEDYTDVMVHLAVPRWARVAIVTLRSTLRLLGLRQPRESWQNWRTMVGRALTSDNYDAENKQVEAFFEGLVSPKAILLRG